MGGPGRGRSRVQRTDRDQERRGPGELESEVLAVLWAVEAPLIAADVRSALGTPTAYNTVQTILTRLLDKGLVTRELVGRAHAYRPVHGQAEFAAHRMHEVMARDNDHTAVLQRFVAGLTPVDEAALRALIAPDPRPVAHPGATDGDVGA